jgi:hypothetical protein
MDKRLDNRMKVPRYGINFIVLLQLEAIPPKNTKQLQNSTTGAKFGPGNRSLISFSRQV